MKANVLFQSCQSEVNEDVKSEIYLSFAIVDRINAVLIEKDMTQRELAGLWVKMKQKTLSGCEVLIILPSELLSKSQMYLVSIVGVSQ